MENIVQLITGDLRIALLLIGVVVVTGIVVWELLQRRRAARADEAHLSGPLGQPRGGAGVGARPDPLFRDEAPRGLQPGQHNQGQNNQGQQIHGQQKGYDEEQPLTLPEISVRDRLVEPRLIDLDAAIRPAGEGRALPVMDTGIIADTDRDDERRTARQTARQIDGEAVAASDLDPSSVRAVPAVEAPVSIEAGSPPAVESSPNTVESPKGNDSLRLDLPEEEKRVIVALRVVARGGERFTGASLRQALQGEGFVHGDMSIFHRAVADGRVLLSAASLTKPGNFDLATMDSSLYLGINLFAVLPGPLPGRDTVDKLLLAGHTLAQRLRGDLQDAKGQTLTEPRLAEMRREAASAGMN